MAGKQLAVATEARNYWQLRQTRETIGINCDTPHIMAGKGSCERRGKRMVTATRGILWRGNYVMAGKHDCIHIADMHRLSSFLITYIVQDVG